MGLYWAVLFAYSDRNSDSDATPAYSGSKSLDHTRDTRSAGNWQTPSPPAQNCNLAPDNTAHQVQPLKTGESKRTRTLSRRQRPTWATHRPGEQVPNSGYMLVVALKLIFIIFWNFKNHKKYFKNFNNYLRLTPACNKTSDMPSTH